MEETVIAAGAESKDIKKDFSRIGLSLTVYLLITTASQILITLILLFSSLSLTDSGWFIWCYAYLPQVLFSAPVCLMMLRTGKRERFGGRLGAGNYALIIIMSIAVMYTGNIIGSLITGIFGAGNIFQSVATGADIRATLLFAVLLAPLVEELIFRRMLIDRLRKYGDKTAILASALLFALMHGNLSQFFYAFGLGALFGYVYARTGKLRYSIGLHMIVNFLGAGVGSLIQRLMNDLDLDLLSHANGLGYEAIFKAADGHMGQIAAMGLYIIAIGGLVVAGLVLLIVRWKKAALSEGTVAIPKGARAKAIFGNAGMIAYIGICTAVIIASLFVKFPFP